MPRKYKSPVKKEKDRVRAAEHQRKLKQSQFLFCEVNDVTTGPVVDGNDDNVGVAAEAADVGIVVGDASQNRNCDCFSFL